MANTDLFLDKPEMKGSTPGISQSEFLSGTGLSTAKITHYFLLFFHLGRQLNSLPMNYKET